MQQKIVASDGIPGDHSGGIDVPPAVDNHVMVVGTNRGKDSKAYVFARVNSDWKEVANVEASSALSYFGERLAMSGNKTIIALDSNAHVYTLEDCAG